ncbi:GWxTD domain-containing protein [bacterium]|nr:MAG: GWxTD domain-containing protein [bacterium]
MKRLSYLILALIVYACSGVQYNQNSYSSTFRKEGYPEVRLYTMGLVNLESKTAISCFVEIQLQSIVSKQLPEGKTAEIQIELIVSGVIDGAPKSFSTHKTINLIDEIEKKGIEPYLYQAQVTVPSGDFTVYVNVTDMQSNKVATVSLPTSVPNPQTDSLAMTNLAFLVKDKGEYLPYLKNAISQRYDSVRLYAQVFNGKSLPDSITFTIEKLESDTLAARPMFMYNFTPGQIGYQGIDVTNSKLVHRESTTHYNDSEGFIEINPTFVVPPVGNYASRVNIWQNGKEVLSKNLLFSVTSPYFPQLRTAKELAAPLVYLMDEKEYQQLMSNTHPDTLKKKIDHFWLSNLQNVNLARQTLKLYYERVEEANQRFTSYKEGWKTDAGMIYILFGSPKMVDQNFRDIYWAYGMYQNPQLYDPERTFIFYEVITGSAILGYEQYLLRRNQSYFQTNRRIIEEWLNGFVLRAN